MACGLLAGLLAGCSPAPPAAPAREIALFTSLPILWRESESLAGALDPQAGPHWAAEALRATGRVTPLDSLEALDGRATLLVMAQPRALSPAENVALDAWVRAGGRLLLFADPLLTQHSEFALGDRRRPEGMVLLSPILRRWGLELTWDEDQPHGQRTASVFGRAIPIDQAGRFVLLDGAKDCEIITAGLAARCRVGGGQVLAIADAALLDEGAPQERMVRSSALEMLVGQAENPG